MPSTFETFRDWLYKKMGGKIAPPQPKETVYTQTIQNTTLYACPTVPSRVKKKTSTFVTKYACPVRPVSPRRPQPGNITKYACPPISRPGKTTSTTRSIGSSVQPSGAKKRSPRLGRRESKSINY